MFEAFVDQLNGCSSWCYQRYLVHVLNVKIHIVTQYTCHAMLRVVVFLGNRVVFFKKL